VSQGPFTLRARRRGMLMTEVSLDVISANYMKIKQCKWRTMTDAVFAPASFSTWLAMVTKILAMVNPEENVFVVNVVSVFTMEMW
jgi:hypothetical protein